MGRCVTPYLTALPVIQVSSSVTDKSESLTRVRSLLKGWVRALSLRSGVSGTWPEQPSPTTGSATVTVSRKACSRAVRLCVPVEEPAFSLLVENLSYTTRILTSVPRPRPQKTMLERKPHGAQRPARACVRGFTRIRTGPCAPAAILIVGVHTEPGAGQMHPI